MALRLWDMAFSLSPCGVNRPYARTDSPNSEINRDHGESRTALRAIARVLRCARRRVARVGQFLDFVHETIGAAPLEALCRAVVAPIAMPGTPGAWYRGWHVMSFDGMALDVGDTVASGRVFEQPVSMRGANATGRFRRP